MGSHSKAIGPVRIKAVPTSEQMVMEFFKSGIPIKDAPRDVTYPQGNIAVKHVNNNFGLTESKMLDAFYFIARNNLDTDDTLMVTMDYFKWLIGQDGTRNSKYLRDCISTLQSALIQVLATNPATKQEDWISIHYLDSVFLTSGKIYFKIPAEIRTNLLKSESYTYISLKINNRFSSKYAYDIYKYCRENAFRNEQKWIEVDEFRRMISGGKTDFYPDTRELNRKVIKPAIEQINSKSNLFITLETKTENRFIVAIRFLIEENPNYEASNKPSLNEAEFKILKDEFGLANSEITEICEYDIETIREKIEFTQWRIIEAIKRKDPIRHVNTYLKKAFDQDLKLRPDEKALWDAHKATQKARKAEIIDAEAREVVGREKTAKMTSKIGLFKKLPPETQQSLYSEFIESEFMRRLGESNKANNIRKLKAEGFLDTRNALNQVFREFLDSKDEI